VIVTIVSVEQTHFTPQMPGFYIVAITSIGNTSRKALTKTEQKSPKTDFFCPPALAAFLQLIIWDKSKKTVELKWKKKKKIVIRRKFLIDAYNSKE